MNIREILGLFSAKRRGFLWIGLATLFCGIGVGSGVKHFATYAQSRDKVIEINDVPPNRRQIMIRDPKVGPIRLDFGTRFAEKGDWLSRTSFSLENVSRKPIVYIRMNVWFPETAKSGQIMVFPLTFGRRPGGRLTAGVEELNLAPNDILDVSLASAYEKMSTFINERQPMDTVSEVKIETSFIVFSDGTAWSVGTFMQVDPKNPSRYIPISEKAPEVQNE